MESIHFFGQGYHGQCVHFQDASIPDAAVSLPSSFDKLEPDMSSSCLTTVSEIITQTTAIEDRKVRKDLQVTASWVSMGVYPNFAGNIRKACGYVYPDRWTLV
jgi:hypothetical protein